MVILLLGAVLFIYLFIYSLRVTIINPSIPEGNVTGVFFFWGGGGCCFVVPGIKPRASFMLGKYSTTKQHL